MLIASRVDGDDQLKLAVKYAEQVKTCTAGCADWVAVDGRGLEDMLKGVQPLFDQLTAKSIAFALQIVKYENYHPNLSELFILHSLVGEGRVGVSGEIEPDSKKDIIANILAMDIAKETEGGFVSNLDARNQEFLFGRAVVAAFAEKDTVREEMPVSVG